MEIEGGRAMGSTRHYYVPDKEYPIELKFRMLCKQNQMSPSTLINWWIRKYVKEQEAKANAAYRVITPFALENYLTSERQTMKKKHEELDRAWLKRKNALTIADSKSK
jgi:hypothetical protein